MTSTEVVTTIRTAINKLNPSLSFQDKDLWRAFTLARSTVYEDKLARNKRLSPMAYHKFCLELQEGSFNQCCGFELKDCPVRKSVHPIPSYLFYSTSSTLKLLNVKNKEIPILEEHQIELDLKYKPGYRNTQVATIVNGYVYLINSRATLIQPRAIWADPLELLFLQKCENNNCLQDNKELIMIEENRMLQMMQLTIQHLGMSLQIPADNTGNHDEKT